jgi:hypothetical protein
MAVALPFGCGRFAVPQEDWRPLPDALNVERLTIRSARAPAWEALFQQQGSDWWGADAVYSVPITRAKTLWLFGDTWIHPGHAREGREGCTMIDNSLAVQTLRFDGGGGVAAPARTQATRPAEFARAPHSSSGDKREKGEETSQGVRRFFEEGELTTESLLRQVDLPEFYWRRDEQGGQPKAPFLPKDGKGRLWPLSGLRLGGKLYLFFVQVVPVDYGIGAKSTGSRVVIVSNPDDAPALWRTEEVAVPFFRHRRQGDRLFGAASLEKDGFVYVYGVRENWLRGPGGRDLILARVDRDGFTRMDFSAWRFLSRQGWTKDLKAAARLFDGTASEMSVSWLPGLKHYVCVYPLQGSSPEIHARFAPQPEGPWSKPVVLHTAHDENWRKEWFYYAAKAHPELATRDNELVVTYATNAGNIGDVARDLRLYWPRFVRVFLMLDTPPPPGVK